MNESKIQEPHTECVFCEIIAGRSPATVEYEDEEVDVDSTILLERGTANHLNTIWANHPVIDIIFDELKGWGEFQEDEGMDDILLYLPLSP